MKRALALGALALLAVSCGEGIRPRTNGEARTASGTTTKRHVILEKGSAQGAFFSDELDGLRKGVGQFLAKQSDLALEIVPVETVDALYAIAASGRRRDGGPVCAHPASAQSIALAAYPAALLAQTDVTCAPDETCTLLVTLVDPPSAGAPGSSEHVRTWIARTSRLDLVRAPTKLVPLDDTDGAGLVLEEKHAEGPRAVHFEKLVTTGTWAARPTLAELASRETDVQACHVLGKSSYVADATLAIDAAGVVTRCEVRGHEDPPRKDHDACLCNALKTTRVAAGSSDRRIALQISERAVSGVDHQGKHYLAGALLGRSDNDGAVLDTSETNVALSRCSIVADAPLRFRVAIDFDGTGKPTGVVAEGEPKAARECVVAAILKTKSSCSKDGRGRRVAALVGGTIEPKAEK